VALAPIAALYEHVEPETAGSTRELENLFTFSLKSVHTGAALFPEFGESSSRRKAPWRKVSLPERIVGHSETI
jgi:hypothetical protein